MAWRWGDLPRSEAYAFEVHSHSAAKAARNRVCRCYASAFKVQSTSAA
jgi:hypothetical protein